MGFVGSSSNWYQGVTDRCKDKPIVEVREDKCKAEGKGWIVDDEVGRYADSGHISRDSRCTRIISQATKLSTLTKLMLKREGSEDGRAHSQRRVPKVVVIRKDQDTGLGPTTTSLYREGTGFKAESESESYYRYPRNPNTRILGMSHCIVHVIMMLTETATRSHQRLHQRTQAKT
jgi:hypothetical protein